MGAINEIDIIADLRTNTDGSGKCLKSATWIYRERCRSDGEAYSVCEACGRILVIDAEIVESDLAGDENAEWSRSGLKFRPKKAMQSTELRTYRLRGNAIGKGVGVVPLEVIRHFGF